MTPENLPDSRVPALRIRSTSDRPVRPDARYVLYWMIGARRVRASFALDRAIAWARHLGRPLVVLEPLTCSYRWASDRIHRFVLQGMEVNHARCAGHPVTYLTYVEPSPGAGRGLVEALSQNAAVVVTDDTPGFFLPRLVESLAPRLAARLEAVDGNGMLPLAAADRAFVSAYQFRRFLQKTLPRHLVDLPAADPLEGLDIPRLDALPPAIRERWPELSPLPATDLARLPIDHSVAPVSLTGGSVSAESALARFVAHDLPRYDTARDHPDEGATSGLSPYLHFGHLGAHQVFDAVVASAAWSLDRLGPRADGKRAGWWGLPPSHEAFADQLVTWRELGFNACLRLPGFDRWESLPAWARATLEAHAVDPRPHLYDLDALAASRTGDEIWNAAQTELREEGTLHNYLRMLWGKKILEWTSSPRVALDHMIELNNRYALDGRDPNSYSGIFWILGRYDRPWGPIRPIFGSIRYMSSANTRRKLRLKAYLARHG